MCTMISTIAGVKTRLEFKVPSRLCLEWNNKFLTCSNPSQCGIPLSTSHSVSLLLSVTTYDTTKNHGFLMSQLWIGTANTENCKDLLLDLWLYDFVLFGAAVFVNLGAAAENVIALIWVGTIKSRVPFTQSVHISGTVFRPKNSWNGNVFVEKIDVMDKRLMLCKKVYK